MLSNERIEQLRDYLISELENIPKTSENYHKIHIRKMILEKLKFIGNKIVWTHKLFKNLDLSELEFIDY